MTQTITPIKARACADCGQEVRTRDGVAYAATFCMNCQSSPLRHPGTGEQLTAERWNQAFALAIMHRFCHLQDAWRWSRRELRLMLPQVLEIHSWSHERKCQEQPGDIMVHYQNISLDVLAQEQELDLLEDLYLTALTEGLTSVEVDADGGLVDWPGGDTDAPYLVHWNHFLDATPGLRAMWEAWLKAMPKVAE